MKKFPAGVTEKLGYYVYVLIDPRDGRIFYVGKGTGNRIFSHSNAALTHRVPEDKLERIRSIRRKGLSVQHLVLRHGLTEKEAFEIESSVIDLVNRLHELPLTNKVSGHEANDRGLMTAEELVARYRPHRITIRVPSLLIVINRKYQRAMNAKELYDTTRRSWVVGKRKNIAKYAFAVYNGVVRQVYEIHGWKRSRVERDGKPSRRWQFDGVESMLLQHYVGGSVAHYLRKGAQNPIRYLNC